MYKRHEVGRIGEELAVEYLLKSKYEIIQRNFMCRQGEIDIIAKEADEFVFVEVKTRTNQLYGKPVDAVNSKKVKHVYKAIEYYIYKNKIQDKNIRIDIIQVYLKGKKAHINHIKNAIIESS